MVDQGNLAMLYLAVSVVRQPQEFLRTEALQEEIENLQIYG